MTPEVQDNRDWGAFIPSFLDDFGLDPFEFRLYSHIARRAGNGGKCWEKIDNIASVCRMERKTAYRAFKFLEEHKLLSVERRIGKTSVITLNHQSVWIAVEPHVKGNRKTTYPKNGIGKVSQKRDTTYTKNGTPTYTKNGTPPIPKTVHKGSPSKVLQSEGTPSKNKEADFVFSEIRDLKDEALDEENINSTTNAKLIQDPIPPTPLSRETAEPEKPVKPLPPDPMGDRMRSGKKSSEWTRLLATKTDTEWLEVLEPWSDIHGLKPNFKASLIEVTKQHLKTSNKPCEFLHAQTCLVNYIRDDKVSSFRTMAGLAEGVEEADRRLESMKITKPECTTTYWYLWGADANAEAIHWIIKPVSEDAPEEERKDRQIAVLNKLLKKLSDRGLLHLAIEGKHKLHSQHVTAANLTLFPEMIQSYGTYLRNKAQQLQGAIAA